MEKEVDRRRGWVFILLTYVVLFFLEGKIIRVLDFESGSGMGWVLGNVGDGRCSSAYI